MTHPPIDESELLGGSIANELAANRTSMAFERTAIAVHRTLLAMLRTSVSLIGFGFTIFKFFTALAEEYIGRGFPEQAARNFGLAMIVIGNVLLLLGIWDHYRSMVALRKRKERLHELGLVHHDFPSRIATSMVVSLLILTLGILALANILTSLP